MTCLKTVLFYVVPLLLIATPGSAQSLSCYDEMVRPGRCLPWGHVDLSPHIGANLVVDLSRDGTSLALVTLAPSVARWTIDAGIETFSNVSVSDPFLSIASPVISDTGEIIAGRGQTTAGNSAFRWDVESGSSFVLPSGPANGITIVHPTRAGTNGTVRPAYVFGDPWGSPSVSGDGDTIAGIGLVSDDEGSEFDLWAFHWTLSGGTSDAPQLDYSMRFEPWAVVGNGNSVVGKSRVDFSGVEEATKWTSGNGLLLGEPASSRATAASYDGQFVAGQRTDNGANGRAFRWTSSGGMQDVTNHRFQPRSVSDDGTLITGMNTTLSPFQSWLWRESDGGQPLSSLLISFGLDGFAASVGDPLAIVSGDGHVYSVLGTQWVAKIPPLKAVALGDSFSSGEGAPSGSGYIPPTDNGSNECHRSVNAYAALASPNTSFQSFRNLALFATPATGFEWEFIACSGAKTEQVYYQGGQNPPPKYYDEDPQLSQGVVDADTDLVTITIGGNDAFFIPVLEDCIYSVVTSCRDQIADKDSMGRTWGQFLPQHITDTNTGVAKKVRDVYDEIKSVASEATIVVLGYPHLFAGSFCASVPTISEAEQLWLRSIGELLNEVLKEQAAAAGVHFVEVASRFETPTSSHNICGNGTPWLNAIDFTETVQSFHPNVIGQRAGYGLALNEFLSEKGQLTNPDGFFESGMPRNP